MPTTPPRPDNEKVEAAFKALLSRSGDVVTTGKAVGQWVRMANQKREVSRSTRERLLQAQAASPLVRTIQTFLDELGIRVVAGSGAETAQVFLWIASIISAPLIQGMVYDDNMNIEYVEYLIYNNSMATLDISPIATQKVRHYSVLIINRYLEHFGRSEKLSPEPRRFAVNTRREKIDPTKRADHEVNRLDGRIQVRADKDLVAAFEATAARMGITKKEAIEEALRAWLSTHSESEPTNSAS
jgi:hypothetical protein